ncbi:MAG: hypothetical protein IJX65_07375 [Alistipes sp.]|nr:hypothetical protein [Alistipes sp.]
MEILNTIIDGYGIAGVVLMTIVILLFIEQIVSLARSLVVAKFKLTSRTPILSEQPPVSIIVPLFGEDEEYLKGDFRTLLLQSSTSYEVVAVYVGKEDAFYATLKHMRKFYKHLKTTHIDYTPQYPITMRLALNIGIKSATYEHIIITTPETRLTTRDWADYMARGFMYGDIVLGYCNWEAEKGLANLFYRKYRFSEVRTYLAEAIRGRQYGAARNCMGFTKSLYFSVRGFDHLDLTAGEDDLFIQRIATPENVAVLLTPHAHCSELPPASFSGWLTEVYRQGQTRQFYTQQARNAEGCAMLCRLSFFVAAIGAIATLPLELKIASALLLIVRYIVMAVVNSKTAARVGEKGLSAWEPIFDFIEPWVRFIIRATQRERISVWR